MVGLSIDGLRYNVLCGFDDSTTALWELDRDGCASADKTPTLLVEGEYFRYSPTISARSGTRFLVYSPERRIHETSGDVIKRHKIDVWDVVSRSRHIRIDEAHQDRITCALFLLNDSMIASCSFDQTAKLWDAKTGALLHVFGPTNLQNWALAASPDGKLLACGAWRKVFI